MSMSQKIKVLVNGHDQKFWYPLQRTLEATGKYEFKEDFWSGHNTHSEKASQELLHWADIIICEWALGNAVYYSQKKLPHQKIVIRLHLQERNTDYPNHINYDNIAAIIFVGQHILDECVQKFNIPRQITHLIPNIIDVKKFDKTKFGDSDFTIGIVGIVPLRKRLDLAYETLKELQLFDKRYALRVKGASPASYAWTWNNPQERDYYEKVYAEINASELRYKVIFDPAGNDVAEWFQSVGYILSPSDFESFHVAPAEGMASGTIPIIWKREGSSDIFPTVIKTDSPKLAAQQIDFFRRSRAGERYKQISQEFILGTFDSKVTAQEWQELLSAKYPLLETKESNKNKKKKLIIFFFIDNWETFHRREMIEAMAKHLDKEYNLLIIEPGEHYDTIRKVYKTAESELDLMLQLEPKRVGDNIYKIRLVRSGLPSGKEIADILRADIRRDETVFLAAKYMFGEDTELLYWIFKHDQLPWVYPNQKVIYEVYDDYAMDFETGKVLEDVRKGENEVLGKVDHVFFTSQPLAYRKSSKARSWNTVSNGVNYNIFAKYRIEDNEKILKKRASVGYLGNLSNFFNWELMCEVVVKMPQIDFIFYGQLETKMMAERQQYVEQLKSYSNTIFTGRVTREEGAVGINLVDVLIIPFVINDAMHAVNPLKLWEYFATGKPVISTPMDAIKVKEPLLRVGLNADEWIVAINNALLEEEKTLCLQRIELARENSWENLTAENAKIIKMVSAKKKISSNKIFILGSCVSRDIFNFPHNFEIVKYCARTSFASFFSPVFGYAEYGDKLTSSFQASMLKDDLLKRVSQYLAEKEFDILLLDFIGDHYNLIRNKENAICVKSQEFINSGILNEEKFDEEILIGSREYMRLWEEGWLQFVLLMKRRGKLHQVLLHKSYWSYETIQKTDYLPNTTSQQIRDMNRFLDELYYIAEKSLPKENIISFDTSIIIGDEKHRWGKSPFHYYFDYYVNALSSLTHWSSRQL